jgi:predicted Zn-dependent protease
MTITPQELVERALRASTADGCVVVVTATDTANVRWANTTVTTSGATTALSWYVVAFVGTATGTVSSTSADPADIAGVVTAAEQAARDAGPAEDAADLLGGGADDVFGHAPERTGFEVFDRLVPSLGAAFDAARGAGRQLYGFARYELATTYLGSSTGLRLRWVQPTGTLEVNAKSADLSRSAWGGISTSDFRDVDVAALASSLDRRLDWAERTVELPPGRYDTVLPPTAVADLMISLAWSAGAKAAHEGRSPFSAPGGGTLVGERLSTLPLSLYADPAQRPVTAPAYLATGWSSDEVSVFDNGAPIGRSTLIDRGTIAGLLHTRASAARYGEPFAPMAENLILAGGNEASSAEQLVGGVSRGLLLTSLWYIRTVDPMTLLLTGLTRDGVYLVEKGEVIGAVNNFRFNMSPLDVLRQVTGASRTERCLPREWSDWFTRTLAPALRVEGFHMSSVSQAQ